MLFAAVFVKFALLAVMSLALVSLPLDIVLQDIGAPAIRRTLGQKRGNEAGVISTWGFLCSLLFTVWLQGVTKSGSSGGAC